MPTPFDRDRRATPFDRPRAQPAPIPDPIIPPTGDRRREPIRMGLTGQAVQGATLGFSDEVAGLAAIVGDLLGSAITGQPAPTAAESFASGRDIARADLAQTQAERPIASTIAQIVGGLGSLRPAVAPIPGSTRVGLQGVGRVPQSTIARVGAPIAAGTGAGALAGFGVGEGGAEERLSEAGAGALLGGGIGGAIPVGGLLFRVSRGITGLQNPRSEAERLILRALRRDRTTVDQLRAGISDARATGQPVALADVGGPSVQRLGRAARSVPGEGSSMIDEFLDVRQLEQGERITNEIRRVISGEDATSAIERIGLQRSNQARPLYEEAFAAPPIERARLGDLPNRPRFRQGYDAARRMLANEGVDIPPLADELPDAFDTRTLDYVKEGIDELLDAQPVSPLTGRPTGREARRLMQFKTELVGAIDSVNPAYRQARSVFADHSGMLDALEDGRRFMRGDEELVERQFRDLSAAEQDAFRIGVGQETRNIVANVSDTADARRRIFGTRGRRQRLRFILGDDGFREFEAFMANEEAMFRTRSFTMGGSQTVDKALEAAEGAEVVDFAARVMGAIRQGGLTAGAAEVARTAGRRGGGLNEETAAQIARMLFSDDQALNAATARALSQASQARAGVGADPTLNRLIAATAALGGVGAGQNR